jgi:mannose-1-phosphate guanylyltransferase/mannose-6-phosphate isomerase
MIIPLILSGGSGSRLWPLSRELYPKQFHTLVGDRTMLQETVLRLQGLPDVGEPLVVCNEEHRFLVAEQLRQIGVSPLGIFLEPQGRNTAPAVAIGALAAQSIAEDPVLLVLPADHVMLRPEEFHCAARLGHRLAQQGLLVTFGIQARAPETGFGYIKKGEPLTVADPDDGAQAGAPTACRIDKFVEKPDLATARAYIESGDFLWNSGMFMFRASRYLAELENCEPEIARLCRESFADLHQDTDFTRLGEEAFKRCPSNSIDYAVMEKSGETAVVPLDAGWSDIGSWSALWEAGDQDDAGNVKVGDIVSANVSNSYLHSESRLIAAIGLDNHIVVETDDAVLVASKDRVQEVKDLVVQLNKLDREERLLHKQVLRPWGSYQGVDQGDRFQVKRLVVKPGAKLSLQLHHKRAEHWVVVRGVARVTRGEEIFTLHEDQSTYIPIETKHQLENIGDGPLELVEVQTGSYLGEDDIVRFEDVYGRA